jgi:HrpA-like RNA helicase
MRRTALEELVLQLRLLEPRIDPSILLQKVPEPPSKVAVDFAIKLLKTIGALGDGRSMPLTPLGFHLAHLPLDARTGKMLIYSALCGCLSPVLTIAACISQRSIFVRNFNAAQEAQQRRAREQRFGHLCSDHLAAAAAYEEYQAAIGKSGHAAGQKLCEELGMSASAIHGAQQLRQRFLQELVGIGFADDSDGDGGARANVHRDKNELVRCMISAGLFPNVAQVQRQHGGQGKVTLISCEREQCAIHPMSLNHGQRDRFASDRGWLLFHQKVKTSQIFLQESTLVGPIPLLLFGSELQVDKTRKYFATGSLQFRTRKEVTTVLLRAFRKELDRLLLLKVADPTVDLAANSSIMLESLTRLLQLEDKYVNGKRDLNER